MQVNQTIALVKGEKPRGENALTKAYHDEQKTEPLTGLSRIYRRKDEDGDTYPNEGNRVQYTANDIIQRMVDGISRLFDLTVTLEAGNTQAKADIVVDGNVLLDSVPVTYLLFLEKKLVDLTTFISKLPTLDPSQIWNYDSATGLYRTDPVETVKTKKIPKSHVLYHASDKHPAQVQPYSEDVVVGYWATTKFSGALEATRADELLSRVRKLHDAVKVAREKANSTEIDFVQVSDKIFGYLFS